MSPPTCAIILKKLIYMESYQVRNALTNCILNLMSVHYVQQFEIAKQYYEDYILNHSLSWEIKWGIENSFHPSYALSITNNYTAR